MDLEDLRFPRQIGSEADIALLKRILHDSTRGPAGLPYLPWSPGIERVLRQARRTGRLARGMEPAAVVLQREHAGIAAISDPAALPRLSRMLCLSEDGGAGLYREAGRLMQRYGGRVLCCILGVPESEMGRVFGRDQNARCVLLTHKETVAEMLREMLRQSTDTKPQWPG